MAFSYYIYTHHQKYLNGEAENSPIHPILMVLTNFVLLPRKSLLL